MPELASSAYTPLGEIQSSYDMSLTIGCCYWLLTVCLAAHFWCVIRLRSSEDAETLLPLAKRREQLTALHRSHTTP